MFYKLNTLFSDPSGFIQVVFWELCNVFYIWFCSEFWTTEMFLISNIFWDKDTNHDYDEDMITIFSYINQHKCKLYLLGGDIDP